MMDREKDERRCVNCERPLVREGLEWLHRPLPGETYAFRYCTILPNIPLSKSPQARPYDEDDPR